MPAYQHDETIRRLHAAGKRDREIAAALGISVGRVTKIRRNRLRLPSNFRFAWTRELLEKIGNRILNGEKRKVIAAELGVSVPALNNALHRHIGGDEYDAFHNPAHRFSRAWTMIGNGATNAEVAAELGVSRDHVRYYRRNMPDWWAGEAKLIRGAANGDASGGNRRGNDAA